MSNSSSANIRLKQAAAEVWPLVKDEKRPSGRPMFESPEGLRNNLNQAFHKGLIDGFREGGKRSPLWVDRESALSYVSKYVDVAKKGRVYWPKRNREPFTGSVSKPQKRMATSPDEDGQTVMESVLGSRYVVVWGDTVELVTSQCGPVPGLYSRRDEAAEAAIDMLGIRLMSVDG